MNKKEIENVEIVEDDEDYSQYENNNLIESELVVDIKNYGAVQQFNNRFDSLKNNVLEEFKKTALSFAKIGFYLSEIDDLFKNDKTVSYEDFGYLNLADFARQEFNISQSACSRMIEVGRKFFLNNYGHPIIKKDYENYNYSQLCELLSVKENHLALFNPDMSVKEIRDNKVKLKLDEFKTVNFMTLAHKFKAKFSKLLTDPANFLFDDKIKDSEKENLLLIGSLCLSSDIEKTSSSDYRYKINCYYSNYKKYPFEIIINLSIQNETIVSENSIKFYSNSPYDYFYFDLDAKIEFKLKTFIEKYLEFIFVKLKQHNEAAKKEKENKTSKKEKELLENKAEIKFQDKLKAGNLLFTDLQYKDYKKEINNVASLKKEIYACKILYNINDETIILFNSNFDIYVKIGNYYFLCSEYEHSRRSIYKLNSAKSYLTIVSYPYNSYEAYKDIAELCKKHRKED